MRVYCKLVGLVRGRHAAGAMKRLSQAEASNGELKRHVELAVVILARENNVRQFKSTGEQPKVR